MPKKTGTMLAWVLRNDVKDGAYKIYTTEPCAEYSFKHRHWTGFSYQMNFEQFEKNFFKLKPGAGPVPVDIMIKRRKK